MIFEEYKPLKNHKLLVLQLLIYLDMRSVACDWSVVYETQFLPIELEKAG
ncbi:hypothetical protein [Streptococcus acidominimus]|nr:hypothetical protein [Streptococcus acidominimus]